MSFTQYKEMYITSNQKNDIETDIETNTDWDFYVNIETPIHNQPQKSIDIDIDIDKINDSLIDNEILGPKFFPSFHFLDFFSNEKAKNPCEMTIYRGLKLLLPIAIIILIY